jgi:predicted RecA/RadA family phage recombinase
MKNYVQDGKYIEFTAGATITSGQLVQVGDLRVLALEGVFTLPKLTAASGDATTAGGPVYFSSGSVSGTDSSGSRKKVGYALAVAAQAATTVRVLLDN